MPNSVTNGLGWIAVNVPDAHIEKALKMRAERDQKYGNIYAERDTDERWVGDLGEIVFKSWLNYKNIKGYNWIVDDAAGKADFLLPPETRVGIKTVKRQKSPKKGYTAQITASHIIEPTDYFFFMTYEQPAKKMWLFGAMEKEVFRKESLFYGPGEKVHDYYTVPLDHSILNVCTSKLVPPDKWLCNVIQS